VMPWYAATHDGAATHAYGVRTGARALCFWQIDPQGISLWADVRSGGVGVELGTRALDVCDVVCRAGRAGESAFAALHAFCRQMCAAPRLPKQPIYGSNDWYWAYGKNSAETVMTDARNIVELSPAGANRPFAVIDDGWQPGRGAERAGTGTWDRGNDKFPDMAGLAAAIRKTGARPGIWIRPLQAPADAPDRWRLPRDRNILDPTIPDVREKIAADLGLVALIERHEVGGVEGRHRLQLVDPDQERRRPLARARIDLRRCLDRAGHRGRLRGRLCRARRQEQRNAQRRQRVAKGFHARVSHRSASEHSDRARRGLVT